MSNMKIVAYSDETFTAAVADGTYEVMLNPDKVQRGRQVQYNQESASGSSSSSPTYSKTNSEKLSFDLVIDCTGVVDSTRVNLPDEMARLSKIIYDYNGAIHRPNYVVIRWGGGLEFRGVLTGFSTSYTLFKPDGTPLRAKLSLEFVSYIDLATLARKEKKSSPDMSHLVQIVEGDTLPQIADDIYRDPAYYVQIARFNKLDKFRRLSPGTLLSVPPLVAQEAGNV
ncbi:hypothetical protein [Pseudomonas sp. MWU13-2105]|uniref:CIS tube protein n=1 Tax=Pseudomonas sp. MWU13-2105 TaxID=2935074 RepID=UPI00200E2CB1|nr:hypothetical protein [Pseudomonas sp. MWU13-2105]